MYFERLTKDNSTYVDGPDNAKALTPILHKIDPLQ